MSQEKKALYRSYLKWMTLIGVIALAIVLFNSLSVEDKKDRLVNEEKKKAVVEVDVSKIQPGSILQIQYEDLMIGILYRREYKERQRVLKLDEDDRSLDPKYFVFINQVGAVRCPLYINPAATELKDICAGLVFDLSGRLMKGSGTDLEIPPHFYGNENTLIIGSWGNDQPQ